MSKCSAPGKIILFGEHAVVFGKPALALAVDLRIKSSVRPASSYLVNGRPMNGRHHGYISAALDEAWSGPPIDIRTRSWIPSGSGLGSSAAVTVATVGALLSEKNAFGLESIAQRAFRVELSVQGRASPTDTSVSTNGRGILICPEKMDNHLWCIKDGIRVWNIHDCEVPELTFVIGYTGTHALTGPLVKGVRNLVESDADARRSVDCIGELVLDGMDAMRKNDKVRVGRLMTENNSLLVSLGVGHPTLDSLIDAASSLSYGAKLTGAGGGGSMIALTDRPAEVCDAIIDAGGRPYSVKVGCEGVRIED
ncbi:MAG: mevalonate kinase [Candidatus Thermoplasmatota archaeon]|nr:mevalonate kinase [Candidatus Thermoplasmatota archaeon]